MDLYHSFWGLGERGLMTPTYLSTLIMLVVLPATLSVEKKNSLAPADTSLFESPVNNGQEQFKEAWINRCGISSMRHYYYQRYNYISKTHACGLLSVNGLETLEAKQKNPQLDQYEIYYCGNAEDAMSLDVAAKLIYFNPNKNHILWNYPGVGFSSGKVDSVHDLYKSGYQQAKRLIEQGIPAEKITLHGYSLGGGVATYVARLLHEEGHLVNLKIDRSFARISSVTPATLKQIMMNPQVENYAPLITSTIALALSGVALGTGFAGFFASVGLVAASATAAMGYIGARCIQSVGFLLQAIVSAIGSMIAIPFGFFSRTISDDIRSLFDNMADYLAYGFHVTAFAINETISTIASFIDHAVNWIGCIVGGTIAIGGLVAGGLAGLLVGMLLSIQLLWTEKPLTMPMTPAFSAVLYSSCCEMDSVSQMHRLLNADSQPQNREKTQPKISVTKEIRKNNLFFYE